MNGVVREIMVLSEVLADNRLSFNFGKDHYFDKSAKEVKIYMNPKTLYTDLSVEECKVRFKEKINKKEHKLYNLPMQDFIGEFYKNEFWVAVPMRFSFFFEGSYKMLCGTITKKNNKNVIQCEFGLSKTFIIHNLVEIFILFLPLSSGLWRDSSFMSGIVYWLIFGLLILSRLFFQILWYYMTHPFYHTMFVLIKETFQCEEGE